MKEIGEENVRIQWYIGGNINCQYKPWKVNGKYQEGVVRKGRILYIFDMTKAGRLPHHAKEFSQSYDG